MPTTKHSKHLQASILDCLCYYAVFGLRLTTEQIFQLMDCKATVVSIDAELKALRRRKLIVGYKDGTYGLRDHNYPPRAPSQVAQTKLLKRAKRLSQALRWMPWIKSVVVVNSVAFGNCTNESDIDLLFVTTPHRLYITKGMVYYLLNVLRLRETNKSKAGRFSLGWWVTTNGFDVERDLSQKFDLQHRYHWLLAAKPVYGDKIWQQLLASSPSLRNHFPNYSFVHHTLPINIIRISSLDKLDSRGFRTHLRHVAQQPQYQRSDAFLRIRPDLVIQNSGSKGHPSQILRQYEKNLEKYHPSNKS